MNDLARQIRAIRDFLKRDQKEFAALVGVTQSTVSRWERGLSEPDHEHRSAIARAAGAFDLESQERIRGADLQERRRYVSVAGIVQAGAWQVAIESPGREIEHLDLPLDPRYPRATRTALLVRGPSMNEVLPPGSLVICVNSLEIGRDPVHGELVIVRRKNPQGEYEFTVKELRTDDGGQIWLWPRSNNPRFQEPLKLESPGEDDQDPDTLLVGIVIASYRPEGPSTPPPPKNTK